MVSTIHSPLYREQSRIRKYTVSWNVALRIWHARKNFYQYFICPLRYVAEQRELRAYELETIKLFKPKLNHPHCNAILKKLRIHVQQYTLPSTTLGLLGNTAFRNTITPPFPTTSATSPSYTPDQRTSTTYSTNFAATQRPNMMWHGCLDPTRHPWRSCTFSSGIVDNWMNLTEHKPPHWLPKPYNSKEDIRHQPTYQSNSIPYV